MATKKPFYKVLLNSSDRDNGTVSRPQFYLTECLGIHRAACVGVALDSVSIPYSWYNVQTGVNDTYVVNGSNFALTAGSPSVDDIVTDINAAQAIYVASFDDVTNTFTLSNASGSNATFETTNAGGILGFENATEFTANVITSTKPADVQDFCHSLQIHSTMAPGVGSFSSHEAGSGVKASTILETVHIGETQPFSRITWQSTDKEFVYQQVGASPEFWISNEYGDEITLPADWTIVLRCHL